MRSSTILTLLGATLAVASPIALDKKDIVYDIITDVVLVTITKGATAPSPAVVQAVEVSSSKASIVSTSTYIPSLPQTTSSTFSEQPTSTYVPPAAPTTSSTSSSPPPPPTTITSVVQAAPVVVTSQAAVASTPAAAAAPHENAAVKSDSSSNPLASIGVSQHNTCRSAHSAPAVTWNATLAAYAAKTAATCVFAHDMNEGGGGYGQNIASQGSSSSTAWTLESALQNAIISEWYSEESMFAQDNLYNQESPSTSGGDWLHFTQIVWKDSVEIGCAVQQCPESNSIFPGMNAWYTVCNYYPQGNVMGEFAQNVLES